MSTRLTSFDWLIIRRLSITYVVLLVALVVFFIVLHYVEFVDDFMDKGATMKDVFLVYYPNYVPEIVRLMSPLGLFLAALFLTGRLAQKLELVALQTSGVSLYRLLLPYAIVGILATGLLFWFNGWLVPESNRVRIRFENEFTKGQQKTSEFRNVHRQTGAGGVLSYNYYDRQARTAHTATLQRFVDGARLVERIDARSMQWKDSLGVWRLRSPVIRHFGEDGSEVRTTVAQLDTVLALLPRNMARTDGDVESMTIPESREYIAVLERAGADNLGLPRVTYYGKFAYPFANLILILLGVPLAAVRRRKGQAMVMGMGMGIAFVYLAYMKLLEPFGYDGQLAPQLAAWLPHVTFLGVAVVVLWRTRK